MVRWKQCIVLCLISAVKCFTVGDELAALRKGIKEYAALHGMRLDQIEVETSDGWLLDVHRVRSMSIFDEAFSPPVLLSHGLGCSSLDYMANLRNESLAFSLADSGYDVWIPNYRANKYSNQVRREGNTVTPGTKDYYRSTWQYIAERDVPAVLDKIMETTGQSKIYVIGQSMGATVLFAFLSQNHTFDDHIPSFAAIAPAIMFGDDTALILRASSSIIPRIVKFLTFGSFFDAIMTARLIATPFDGVNRVVEDIQGRVCLWMPRACFFFMNFLFGRRTMPWLFAEDPNVRKERLPIMFTKYPAGVTVINSYLYAQEIIKGSWTKMDYDLFPQMKIKNEEEYHQKQAPSYAFESARVPFDLFYSLDDVLAGPKTISRIIDVYSPSATYIIKYKWFSHQDTLWGWNARCVIYDKIIDSFNRLEIQRAETGRNTTTNSLKKMNEKRAHYRLVVVPEFIKRLPFDKNCPPQ